MAQKVVFHFRSGVTFSTDIDNPGDVVRIVEALKGGWSGKKTNAVISVPGSPTVHLHGAAVDMVEVVDNSA